MRWKRRRNQKRRRVLARRWYFSVKFHDALVDMSLLPASPVFLYMDARPDFLLPGGPTLVDLALQTAAPGRRP